MNKSIQNPEEASDEDLVIEPPEDDDEQSYQEYIALRENGTIIQDED